MNLLVKFNYAPSEHLVFVRVFEDDKSEDPIEEYKVKHFKCFVMCRAVLDKRKDGYKRSMHMEADCKKVHYDKRRDLIELLY